MNVARQNIVHDKIRFALSVAGIALAIALILLLNGMLTGVLRQASAYLDHAPGSVVVAPVGADSFLLSSTALSAGTTDAVRATSGVADVVPLLSQMVVVQLHGRREAAFLIGFDPALGGGPWSYDRGRAPEADDEVVLDRTVADRHDIAVGDTIDMMGRPFKVSGLSKGTSTFATTMVFARKSALESLMLAPGATSFLLVTPARGVSAAELRDRLASVPGTSVWLKDVLADKDVDLLSGFYRPPVRLMVGIAFLVGTMVVGLVIYAATLERRQEYGVLKAIGVRNRLLYRLVTVQALIAAVLGSVIGLGLAVGAAWLIVSLRPQFAIAFAPGGVVAALLAGLVMALVAAILPARVVAGLAPADVFRR